jgi:outer membrane protein assembly factor BamB
MRRWLTLALITALLPGCSWIKSWGDEDDLNAPAELVEFTPTIKTAQVWKTKVGDGQDRRGMQLRPAYSAGTVYAAGHKGRLLAVASETGVTRWEVKTDLPFSGGPGLGESRVLMGTQDGRVLAFTKEDGSLLWSAVVSSEILAAPAEDEGIVVVRCIDGRVFGFRADNGERLWIYDHSVPLLTLRGNAPPLVRAGVVFVGYDGGEVVALRLADGIQLWEQAVVSPEGRTELERLADIDGQLVFVASDLLVSSYKNRLASLAADSGRLLWFKDVSSATGVVVDRTNLAISDASGELWMLDRRNGTTLWKQDQLARRGLTRPAFYGKLVVVGDNEGYLHWLDTEDGSFVSRNKVGGKGFTGPPVAVGTTLFAMTRSGELVAYRAGAAL